jgi:hypothetical protein
VIHRRVHGPIGSMRTAGADTNIEARGVPSGGEAGSVVEPAAEPAAGAAEP